MTGTGGRGRNQLWETSPPQARVRQLTGATVILLSAGPPPGLLPISGWGGDRSLSQSPRPAPSWASGVGLAQGAKCLLQGPLCPTWPPGTGWCWLWGQLCSRGLWFPECLWEPVRLGAPKAVGASEIGGSQSVELARGAMCRAGGPGAGRGQPRGLRGKCPPRSGPGPGPLQLRSHFSHLNFEHKL